MKKLVFAALVSCACLLQSAHASNKEHYLELDRVSGGQLDDVVVYGTYAYVANGRTVATWSHANPAAPDYLGAVEMPASGRLTGLARSGYYLYASWQTGFNTSGVAVYSLVEPGRPKLVNEVSSGNDYGSVYAMTAAKRHLYIFDAENGLIVGSLTDPEKPSFTTVGIAAGVQYQDAFVDGNWIHVFGKNFLFNAVLTSIDITNPSKPVEGGVFAGDGVEFFDMNFRSPFAVTFGLNLSVIDMTDPTQPLLRGSASGPPSLTGIVNGQYAYGVGFQGLDVWSIENPDKPAQLSHLDVDTLATEATARVPGGALMLTRTDRLMYLDTSKPTSPRVAGTALSGGSIDAYDAAMVGDTVLLMQQNYGLAVLDSKTLDVVSRYEFDLPPSLQGRAFNDMHVDGGKAFLAAWGYGLFIADVSTPTAPKELGREVFPAAHTVSVADGYAWLGKNTNGTELGIVDVRNLEDPDLIAVYSLPYTPAQVEARPGFLYIASYPLPGSTEPAGLRIIDTRDPFGLFEASVYNDECTSAFGVAFADDEPIAFLACSNGLHILDVSNPALPPVRLAFVQLADSADTRTNVEVRGNRAWYASSAGLYEIDVTYAKRPRILNVTDLAGYGVVNVRAIGGHRLLALTGTAGVHILESNATALENHVPVRDLEGKRGAELLFRIEVPEGARELCLETHSGKGDITLYTKLGDPPTASDYDARSKRPKTREEITIRNPKPGTWFVKVIGETAFERVTLKATYR
jgi:hypothetical protein